MAGWCVGSRGLGRLWSRRAELFGDIASGAAVYHAMVDAILLPGEGNEWVNIVITEAVGDLIYDPYAPGGIRSPLSVSDEELASAGVRREELEYWVARERVAFIDNGGARVEDVRPLLGHSPNPQPVPRGHRCAPRARSVRRRARRVARAPDDPSRPRRSRLAAVLGRPGRLA
jgi:hypothetical protein